MAPLRPWFLLAGLTLLGVVGLALLLAGGLRDGTGTADTAHERSDWIAALAEDPLPGFDPPDGPFVLSLPADHAPHPEARSELWQLTAHLTDDAGRPVGLQMLLLRLALGPPGPPDPAASVWQAQQVYRGHVVIVAPGSEGAVAEERFGRALPGLVGHDPEGPELRLDGWRIGLSRQDGPGLRTLDASAGALRAELTLRPMDQRVVAGDGQGGVRGYALSRLAVEGVVALPSGPVAVSGSAWFDHLWGDLPAAGAGPVASDRLQLHLDDGSDLGVVRTRRRDGRGLPTVDTVLVDPDGGIQTRSDGEVTTGGHWQGLTGLYPLDWQLRLGDLDLRITPVVQDQDHAFAAPVWSGLVRAEGQRGDAAVSGIGTLQLTGYDTP